jgi:hypothetical protein
MRHEKCIITHLHGVGANTKRYVKIYRKRFACFQHIVIFFVVKPLNFNFFTVQMVFLKNAKEIENALVLK